MSMVRAATVEAFLAGRASACTVREICDALGYPRTDAKFVSRLMTAWVACGKVTASRTFCQASQRDVTAYAWSIQGAQSWGAKKRGQRGTAKPKAMTEEERRAEMYRQAAAEARKRREAFFADEQKKNQIAAAWSAFARITDCQATTADAARQAYRQAALKFHPDRGGDQNVFIELATSYSAIKASF